MWSAKPRAEVGSVPTMSLTAWFSFESKLCVPVTERATNVKGRERRMVAKAIEQVQASTPVRVDEGSQALKMPGRAVPAKVGGAQRPPRGLKLSTTAPL